MRDDLQRAYSAYQQALYLLPSPKVRSTKSALTAPYLMKHLPTGRPEVVVRNRYPV